MWSITSYYNPARYKRRLSNYRIFRKNLATPLVTVELSFDGDFELRQGDADILIQISGGAILWQKERLLNLAIKSVPPEVRTIAWIDCDVIFDRSDWVEEARRQLANFNVVQLYSDLIDLGRADHELARDYCNAPRSAEGIVSVVKEKHQDVGPLIEKGRAAGGQSMGLAWAASKQVLEAQGLYDAMIIGSGDRLLIGTVYGHFQKIIDVFKFNEPRQKHYLSWARPFYETVGTRVGYVSGCIYHLWHGDVANRKTLERHRLLPCFDFDPAADLLIGSNGAWQWARSRPDLEQFLVNYFNGRAEDG
jgi:hypothetical protein